MLISFIDSICDFLLNKCHSKQNKKSVPCIIWDNFQVAEFANVRKQLEVLEDRLDEMVLPRLVDALTNRKVYLFIFLLYISSLLSTVSVRFWSRPALIIFLNIKV